jgi:hypothetical protein
MRVGILRSGLMAGKLGTLFARAAHDAAQHGEAEATCQGCQLWHSPAR